MIALVNIMRTMTHTSVVMQLKSQANKLKSIGKLLTQSVSNLRLFISSQSQSQVYS